MRDIRLGWRLGRSRKCSGLNCANGKAVAGTEAYTLSRSRGVVGFKHRFNKSF